MSTGKKSFLSKTITQATRLYCLTLLASTFLNSSFALAQDLPDKEQVEKETQLEYHSEADTLQAPDENITVREKWTFDRDFNKISAQNDIQPYADLQGDIPTLIGQGNYDITLTGDSTWNYSLVVSNANNNTNFSVDGQGNTVTVLSDGSTMIDDFRNNSNVTLKNINFVPSATFPRQNDYLIGTESTFTNPTLDLEGSSFTGFSQNTYKKGGLVYAWAAGSNLTINGGEAGVTFRNNRGRGDYAGAVAVYRSNLTFNGNVNFDNNWSGNYGGAINVYNTEAGNNNKLVFNGNTTFTNNHAYVFGGAVDVWGGAATVEFNGPSDFTGNYVSFSPYTSNTYEHPEHVNDQHARGGAINIGYLDAAGAGTSVTFNNTATFNDNYVYTVGNAANNRNAYGGAISVYGNGTAKNYQLLFNSGAHFNGNYVNSLNGVANGGAIFYDSSTAQLTFNSNTSFTDNYAKTLGGAIYLSAGDVNLNATDGDILFQGNRHGASFDPTTGKPIAGSGTPNAIYLGSSGGTLNFDAETGRKIEFYDPIASVNNSNMTVTKKGDGDIIFYGDGSVNPDYDSAIQGNTTVQGGNFLLTDGVRYGSTSSGIFTVQSGGAVGGGNNATLRSNAVNIQSGGAITGTGNEFTIESANINLANGTFLTGQGNLNATSNLKLAGSLTADIAEDETLKVSALMQGTGASLVKTGAGTLELGNKNTYTGATSVNQGTLQTSTADAFAASTQVTVADGALLDLNDYNQRANEFSGAGDVDLGSATLTANNAANRSFSGSITGSGVLTKTGAGNLTLSGASDYAGGTNINEGAITASQGSSLGTGRVNVTSGSVLNLDFADEQTFRNQVVAAGQMNKNGNGTAILTSADSYAATVNVNAGALSLQQNGTFTAGSYTTATNATTEIAADAALQVNGTFSQNGNAVLTVAVGEDAQPKITTGAANISGTLNVSGYQPEAPLKASELDETNLVVIASDTAIQGDFTTVNTNELTNPIDYLTMSAGKSADQLSYNVGLGLTWNAAANKAQGDFTLTNAADTFELDVALQDRTDAITTGWDGKSLSKKGDGTLVLGVQQGYSGQTDIQSGTLSTMATNAFAGSSQVTVADGATLALNGYSQRANEFSAAGNIQLGSGNATLTVNNATGKEISGNISGSGSLTKIGDGDLTLSGVNSQTTATNINGGSLTATNGQVFGTSQVNLNNNTTLNLNFDNDELVSNKLFGNGTLNKNGTGSTTLSNADSALTSINLNQGELAFVHDGNLLVNNYTALADTTTALNATAKLETTTFIQNAGSNLNVEIGAGDAPVVTANTANITGANLEVTGYGAQDIPAKASLLDENDYVIIETTGGITGNFATVDTGGATSTVDYLTVGGKLSDDRNKYSLGMGLTWNSTATDQAHGDFTLTNSGDSFELDLALQDKDANANWDGQSLSKKGDGTLILATQQGYSGATDIEAGTLATTVEDAFIGSNQVTLNQGATLAMNGNNQSANEFSGAGNVQLGSGTLTVNNLENREFSGLLEGSGNLTKLGGGDFTLSGNNTYSGQTEIRGGSITTTNGNALGTSSVNVEAGNALNLNFTDQQTVNNKLTGGGSINKNGNGTATLTNNQSEVGTVNVNSGTLSLQQNGTISADNYTTAEGATTTIGASSQLAAGSFVQEQNSTLNVNIGTNNSPAVSANTAKITDSHLNITGFGNTDAPGQASQLAGSEFVVIETTGGITGDFANVDTGGATSSVDYLVVDGKLSSDQKKYTVGLGLAWDANNEKATGNFTLAQANDAFELDVVLKNQAGNANWDGQSLTKKGDGTLILSEQNEYTGKTDVQAGTLETKTEDAFASSNEVQLGQDATLAMNGFNQTANDFHGAGKVQLGDGTLTVNNNIAREFSGSISGEGSLIKEGTSDLLLSGNSTYAGGTSINGGSLTVTTGNALGTGTVSMNGSSALNMNFAAEQTLVNKLDGTGSLVKEGAGNAILTGSGSQVGNVTVSEGTLSLAQNGAFTADNYTTTANGTTALGENATLELTGSYEQAAGGNLSLALDPDAATAKISAVDASLGGKLYVTGFDRTLPASALMARRDTVITTQNNIIGNFSDVEFGGPLLELDYLVLDGQNNGTSYDVGYNLSWRTDGAKAHGDFTLANAGDVFDVDIALTNRTDNITSGWDGTSLTKKGDGTLILSAQNEYTGKTAILDGTLSTMVDQAFATSSEVELAAGATLAVNGHSQTANEFHGAGQVQLGNNGALTVNNNGGREFSGSISGSGSLNKEGTGNLTLSGTSDFTGTTDINAGQLTVTSGSALGSSVARINTDTSLVLDFESEQTFGNQLQGAGELRKTGSGNANLTGAGSAVGSVAVDQGSLSFAQTGGFTAGSLTVNSGGTAAVAQNATVQVNGRYQQAAGGNLALAIGQGTDNVKLNAQAASVDGNLYITGFDRTLPASALMARRDTVLTTQDGITGNFSTVDFGGPLLDLDYLVLDGAKANNDKDYSVGYNLTWNTDASRADGSFTLADAQDNFEVDVVLADKTGPLVSGWDGRSLDKKGEGTLLLSEHNTYTGSTAVQDGTLLVGNTVGSNAQIGGAGVTVSEGAVLSGTGLVNTSVNNAGTLANINSLSAYAGLGTTNLTVGQLTNSGTLLLAGREVGNTLTVQGGLTGNDGKLVINTVLGDDASLTDKLILDGGATTGSTGVVVNNRGGLGGTTETGILVVDAINGATTSSDAFNLSEISSGYRSRIGTLAMGAFDYDLVRGGNGGAQDSWYLVSDQVVRPEGGSYLVNSETAQSMFYHSMRDRLDNYEIVVDPVTGEKTRGTTWGRIKTDRSRSYAGGSHLRTNTNRTVMQAGWDLYSKKSPQTGSFKAGIMAGYGTADSDTKGPDSYKADGDVNAYLFGAYATWFQDPEQQKGWYVDAWAQNAWFKNKMQGGGLASESYDASMFSASVETGYAFDLNKSESYSWQLIPQAQLTYNNYSADSFRESSGTNIRMQDGNFYQTRLGVRLQGKSMKKENATNPYLELNWLRRNKTSSLSMDDFTIHANGPKSVMELKTGLELQVKKKLSLGLDLSYQMGKNDYRNVGAQIGLRYHW